MHIDGLASVRARIRRLAVVLSAFATLLLLAAVPASAEVFADFDARSGSVAPSAAQKQMVSDMGATAQWNDFGTPSSLIKYGGYLAAGLQGPNAASVARNWIDSNSALFRLSSADGLTLLNDGRLSDSEGYAVLFGQEFGGIAAAEDGKITVGVVGSTASGWKVVYASSALTGDSALGGPVNLSATEAWMRAATNVGRGVPISAVGTPKSYGGWKIFSVRGLTQVQRARLAALPTATGGVRPVFETIYLDNQGGAATAYHSYVDAETGEVLIRKDIVEQSHPTSETFNGVVPPVDGACATPKNGPWTVLASETVGSIVVGVEAVVTANDAVIHLYRDGVIVASQDTATSPEALVYVPGPVTGASDVYEVEVCDFVDATPWIVPTNYVGSIVFNPAEAGVPYPPMWKVFPANPLIGNQEFQWNYPSTDSRKLWCWESTVGFPPMTVVGPNGEPCERAVQNLASRFPWDVDGFTQTPTFTTSGNNARTAEAWTSPLTPGPFAFRPIQPNRKYVYNWTNEWHTSNLVPAQPARGCTSSFTPGVSTDVAAATTNLFAMHNRVHDWSYFLGFTERRWNAQDSNFAQPTADRDPVVGDVQAGAATGGAPSYLGRDNANMISLPDGVSPITNMYLWQPLAGAFYAPCVDGDYDMAVIGHEYSHMIENRMIGKGGTRGGHHAGAMGESFGDFDAAEYLNEYSFVPVAGENPFSVGAYVTGNKQRAIRSYGMNFPRTGAFPSPGKSLVGGTDAPSDPKINPLNFSDHGFDITGAQVHADGEIWSATNFDIRQELVTKYNGSFPASNAVLQRRCADGELPAYQCPGNRRWIQIVYDAMLLMPTAPSMLQARDAYLAADMMRAADTTRPWPSNQAELWLAFARRGFGKEATSSNAVSNENDADPKPDFQRLVPNTNATVRFNAVASNEGNAPVKARIFVGHYEARVSPIADTNSTTGPPDSGSGSAATAGASNLDNRAGFAPGTYEFVARADGYGHVRFRQTFTAGQTTTITISMPTNHASTSKGGVATGDGTASTHQLLIDDKEGTDWDRNVNGAPVNTTNPQVTVRLAGPRTINRAQVSTLLEPGENRFTALRRFRLETSTNGVTFSPWITSVPNAFPGFNPRPVAPEMILREFTGSSRSGVTHVRIVVLHNQCTGNTAFQGEQDNDPANATDCRFGSPGNVGPLPGDSLPQVLADRDDEVHIAELQVFGSAGGTNGGGNPPPPPPPGGGDDCDEDDDIVKLGPPAASPGSTIEYTITFTNLGGGSDDDDECEIDDLLGDDLTYVSSTGGGSYDPVTRTVSWNTGSVAAGAARTVTLTARISDAAAVGTMIMNQAYFGRLGLDFSPLGTATTTVLP